MNFAAIGGYPSELPLLTYRHRFWEGVVNTAETLVDKPQRSIIKILQARSNHEIFLGWNSLDNHRGFISDGSFYIPRLTEARADSGVEQHLSWLEQQQRMYEVGSGIDTENISYVAEILALAEANGSVVLGYMPPYHSVLYTRMITSGDYTYIPLARTTLQATFADYNMPFFDFTEIETIAGASDDELFDGWHPGELLDMRMYSMMLHDQFALLADYSDVSLLDAQIETASNPFYVYTTPLE